MKISNEVKLDFDDVLIVPARSINASRQDVDVTRQFSFYHSTRIWDGIPIIASNMDTVGTCRMAEKLTQYNLITCINKYYNIDKVAELYKNLPYAMDYIWVTIGMNNEDVDKLKKLIDTIYGHIPNICIDIANGYTDKFVEYCYSIRKKFSRSSQHPIIMAGNICTPEMVQELILHGGVDIVKVGIGPGSVCTTRMKTGVGYPQLSAIDECAHAAHGLKRVDKKLGLICADGGCRVPADVCKAMCANADFVMLGGMFAGTDECDGEWEYHTETVECIGNPMGDYYNKPTNKKKALKFYGMSSFDAQKKHCGCIKDYRASEGRVQYIPYKGSVDVVVQDILGGIRSCCSYIGATCIKDMGKCAKFVRVNRPHFNSQES